MFVDPGTGGTGWAIFDFSEETRPLPPEKYGAISPPKKLKTWRARFDYVTTAFADEVLFDEGPDRLVLEWPEIWGYSARSRASAGRGDLTKLAALCGAFQLAARQNSASATLLVTPRAWKGELSKRAVDSRIRRALGERYPNHVSDAVGMGLAAQGEL
jgi:Holliday junction resolvasome RuvABC endonuclease subunit